MLRSATQELVCRSRPVGGKGAARGLTRRHSLPGFFWRLRATLWASGAWGGRLDWLKTFIPAVRSAHGSTQSGVTGLRGLTFSGSQVRRHRCLPLPCMPSGRCRNDGTPPPIRAVVARLHRPMSAVGGGTVQRSRAGQACGGGGCTVRATGFWHLVLARHAGRSASAQCPLSSGSGDNVPATWPAMV